MNPGIFFLRVVGAMVPAFGIWWFIGSAWLQPAVTLTEYLLSAWLPKIFFEFEFLNDTVIALTHWQREKDHFVPASWVGTCLTTDFNIRVLSYSFPFFIALQAALWQKINVLKILLSLFTLYGVLIISLGFIIAKRLMINLQLEPVFNETANYWYANPEFIILGYQVATLLLPTLIPMLLWVAINQEKLNEFIKR